jgi:hypothetical protein
MFYERPAYLGSLITLRAESAFGAAQIGSRHAPAGQFSFPRGLASSADLLADGPAPSWLVRVGPYLGAHFPARNLRGCVGCGGLLVWEHGRRLSAIFPAPTAKETHSAIVDRRLAGPRLLSCTGLAVPP